MYFHKVEVLVKQRTKVCLPCQLRGVAVHSIMHARYLDPIKNTTIIILTFLLTYKILNLKTLLHKLKIN